MATQPERFGEIAKPVDLEAAEAAAERGHRAEEPSFFPIGDIVRLWRPKGGGREDVRMDVARVGEGNRWRVVDYDEGTKTYSVEFVDGGGTFHVTEEQLKRYNPEREERIRREMEKPPGETVH